MLFCSKSYISLRHTQSIKAPPKNFRAEKTKKPWEGSPLTSTTSGWCSMPPWAPSPRRTPWPSPGTSPVCPLFRSFFPPPYFQASHINCVCNGRSTIGQPTFYTTMGLAPQGEPGYARTARLLGVMNGLCAAGSALGALFNAWSADRLSRKYSIMIGAVILVVGAALCAGSVSIAMFIVARFVTGWGIGIMISVVPM